MKVTLSAVNRMLKEKGVAERLHKGTDFFFFAGGDAGRWRQSGVYVSRVDDLSLLEWWNEREALASE